MVIGEIRGSAFTVAALTKLTTTCLPKCSLMSLTPRTLSFVLRAFAAITRFPETRHILLACLLECVLAGEADPAKLHRPRIAKVLANNTPLLERLRKARSDGDSGPVWAVENDRVKTVVLKLARGHAAYEYNEPRLEEPDCISFKPIVTMDETERQAFEGSDKTGLAAWPEVGSRAMRRLLVVGSDVYSEGWLVIQEGNYRFHVSQEDGLTVNIVLREYLRLPYCLGVKPQTRVANTPWASALDAAEAATRIKS
jgi:hypothetical protein